MMGIQETRHAHVIIYLRFFLRHNIFSLQML